jgi:hypothetical protein
MFEVLPQVTMFLVMVWITLAALELSLPVPHQMTVMVWTTLAALEVPSLVQHQMTVMVSWQEFAVPSLVTRFLVMDVAVSLRVRLLVH